MDLARQEPVYLSPVGRAQSIYAVGITGTGKSNFLLDLALQDINSPGRESLVVIDPHGDLAEDILGRVPPQRVKDVLFFNAADMSHPFGFNPFECSDRGDPITVERVSSEALLTFKKIWREFWGPRMDDIIRHCILALILGTPDCTPLDMLPFLTSPAARARYLSDVEDRYVLRYWKDIFPKEQDKRRLDEWISSTVNKVGRFASNPLLRHVIGQPKSTIDWRAAMDGGKIVVVSLPKGLMGEENSALLGSLVVGKLLIAALGRADTPPAERRRCHVIVDEYHAMATESFPVLQSEARKYAVDLTVAHQNRAQLDDLNRGSSLNVGNLILFRTTGIDARELALQFDATPEPGDKRLQPVGYPSGRPGIARTGGDYVLADGPSRQYSDMAAEIANKLSNADNFTAHCRLVDDEGKLIQRNVRMRAVTAPYNAAVADRIRKDSQGLASPVADVKARLDNHWSFGDLLTEAKSTPRYSG